MHAATSLSKVLDPCLAFMHKARFEALCFVARGLLPAGRLGICSIGRAHPSPVAAKHCIKRVDRLLGNPHLHRELVAVQEVLAAHLVTSARPLLLLDWTHLDDRFSALVASVPADGRSIPICTSVQPRRMCGNRKAQKDFLARFRAVLPAGCRPIIVADAGFLRPFWRAVEAVGWDWLVRIGGHLRIDIGQRSWVKTAALYPHAARTATEWGYVRIGERQSHPCRLVLAPKPTHSRRRHRRREGRGDSTRQARKRNLEPWVLATSLDLTELDEQQVVSVYRQRMQIEESFRDLKSHRFGWSMGTLRLTTAARWETLLVVASVAMAVQISIGRAAEVRGQHRALQANSKRHRRVLSLFYLGRLVIDRLALATPVSASPPLLDLRSIRRDP